MRFDKTLQNFSSLLRSTATEDIGIVLRRFDNFLVDTAQQFSLFDCFAIAGWSPSEIVLPMYWQV